MPNNALGRSLFPSWNRRTWPVAVRRWRSSRVRLRFVPFLAHEQCCIQSGASCCHGPTPLRCLGWLWLRTVRLMSKGPTPALGRVPRPYTSLLRFIPSPTFDQAWFHLASWIFLGCKHLLYSFRCFSGVLDFSRLSTPSCQGSQGSDGCDAGVSLGRVTDGSDAFPVSQTASCR